MRNKATLFALSLLSGTILAAVAAPQFAAELARGQIAAAIARVPGAAVAAIHADPWTGQVEIDGLSYQNGGARVALGKIAFQAFRPLPSFIAPAFAADGTASVQNLTFNVGVFKFAVDRIDATGTSMTSADLADIVNPASPTPIADRIAKFTAAAISIPQITEDMTMTPGESVEIVYKNTQLTNVVAGKIGSATTASATITGTDPAQETLDGSYGAITTTNLDLGLIARILTTTRTDANAPLEPLYDSATVSDMKFTEKDTDSTATISIGKISANNIEARPLSTSFTDIFSLFNEMSAADKPTPAETKSLIGVITDAFGSFQFGAMDVNNMAVDVTGDQAANVELGHIGISGWANGMIGSIAYDGLVVNSTDGTATIGNFTLKGLNFAPTLTGLQAVAAQDNPDFSTIDPRSLIPGLDQISLSGMAFDMPDQQQQGNAANGGRDQFKLDKFEIDLSHYFNGIPTALTTVVQGFAMAIPQIDTFSPLTDLGYTSLTLGSKFDVAWNGPAQQLSLNEFSANVAGMGSFRLQATLGNVTQDVFSTDPSTEEAAATGILLKSVDLYVQDDGLFDKGLAYQAQQANMTADALRSQLIATAGVGIPAALGNGAAAKTIADAVTKFIAQPKNLHITATSATGVGAGDMALLDSPGDLLDKLDVTATADQ